MIVRCSRKRHTIKFYALLKYTYVSLMFLFYVLMSHL